MSAYKQQEFDFIHRTKEILKQYEKFQIDENEKYEVTLFLNCLVGLLILPQQYWYDNLPTELISQKKWGIRPDDINGEKDVKNVVRHLRNSIAHYHFEVFSNTSKQINKIKFEDFEPDKNKKTFEATISVSNLKKFANEFADYVLSEMKNQKPATQA